MEKETPKARKPRRPPANSTSSFSTPSSLAMATTNSTQRKTKKQKLQIEPLSEKILSEIPESQYYTQLLELERRLDATMRRKQTELSDAIHLRTNRSQKVLRLTISNTYQNQRAFYYLDDTTQNQLEVPPSWTLIVEGSLIEDLPITLDKRAPTLLLKSKKKFTSLFKKIVVILENNDTIEWDKGRSTTSPDADGFEIKRIGDRNCEAEIFLHLDYNPPRFKLSPLLAKALSLHTETRPRIIMALWQYIKLNCLQDPEDRRNLLLNDELTNIFKRKTMSLSSLIDVLREHLLPPDPIHLTHKIRTVGTPQDLEASAKTYSIQFEEDEPDGQQFAQQLLQKRKELVPLEEQIQQHVEKANDLMRKRQFMVAFSNDPICFVNNLLASQARDAKLIQTNEVEVSPANKIDPNSNFMEEERHADYYDQPFISEAVQRYLLSSQTSSDQ